jgi:diguanylate cyclase (GGDEF)-like protein
MRTASSILLALIGLVSMPLAATASTATEPTIEQAISDGIVALQAEVMLLVALDGYAAPVPAELMEVHDAWSSYMEGMSRGSLLDWLQEVDANGSAARDDLEAAGVLSPPEIEMALGALGPERLASLAANERTDLDPLPYVTALDMLNSGSFEVGAPVPPEVTTTTSPVTTTLATTPTSTLPTTPTSTLPTTRPAPIGQESASMAPATGEGSAAPGSPSTNATAIMSAIVAAVALVTGIVVGVRGRRRSHRRSEGGFDQLLEAGRRMTKALDRDEIARIAMSDAMSLADATHGAFVAVDEGGMDLLVVSDDIFDRRRLDEGVLQRVADTGQPINVVSHDEPSLTALPVAILAVPVIGSGRVTGIITLVRPDHRPFGGPEDAIIGRLAPMVGSALAAADRHDGLTALSFVDPLTSLPNRRSLDRDIVAGLAAPGVLAVAMIDVDHFKNFNDTNGHAAGDEALRAVGRVLASGLRSSDRAYRYGGEEFSLLLRVRDAAEAGDVAERFRREVEDSAIPGEHHQPGGRLTISIGVALVTGGGGAPPVEAALAAADKALYRAKETGRNTVVVAEPVRV